MSNHQHKPKPQRVETPGTARFLTFGCFRRKRLFRFDGLCSILLEQLHYQANKTNIHVWSYVIMPNHIHLLVYPTEDTAVRDFLTVLKHRTARKSLAWLKINQPETWYSLQDAKGQLAFWQRGGGYDRSLWTPDKIRKAMDYIHDNPVRAGLVTDAMDYKWSSLGEWLSGRYSLVNPKHVPVV